MHGYDGLWFLMIETKAQGVGFSARDLFSIFENGSLALLDEFNAPLLSMGLHL